MLDLFLWKHLAFKTFPRPTQLVIITRELSNSLIRRGRMNKTLSDLPSLARYTHSRGRIGITMRITYQLMRLASQVGRLTQLRHSVWAAKTYTGWICWQKRDLIRLFTLLMRTEGLLGMFNDRLMEVKQFLTIFFDWLWTSTFRRAGRGIGCSPECQSWEGRGGL